MHFSNFELKQKITHYWHIHTKAGLWLNFETFISGHHTSNYHSTNHTLHIQQLMKLFKKKTQFAHTSSMNMVPINKNWSEKFKFLLNSEEKCWFQLNE